MDEYIEVFGTVTSVIYQNEENGYTVLRMDTDEGEMTVVGCMPYCSPGESISVTGRMTRHQSYGLQLKAEVVERSLPAGEEHVYEYLASGVIQGVGPATARLIVERFKDKALEVIGETPERLAEIRGISHSKALKIGSVFRRREGVRRLMEFLTYYDISPKYAVQIYKCYGDESISAIREDPYVLSDTYFGVDFLQVDAMALSLGVDPEADERVRAAVKYELEYNLNNGHSFIAEPKLAAATARLIDVDAELAERGISSLCEREELVKQEVCGVSACYLARLYEAETYTAERLKEMAGVEYRFSVAVDKLLKVIEREQKINYSGKQRRAVELAASRKILAITGGPGTGKTTSVRGILAMLDKLELNTVLAAPTGRAAKRLGELTGKEALTIHRLLETGFSAENGLQEFKKDEHDQLEADAVILDETSMVDIVLMRALLAAMKPECRLILVGDADQLPSVGPGNVFMDIIRSGIVDVVKLDEIFRQAESSIIVRNAHMINRGEMPPIRENSGDFYFMKRQSGEKTAETVVDLVAKRLPENMGIPSSQIQVLSPTRRNESGTINLNMKLQERLNPPHLGKSEKIFGEIIFREGDKVMQIKNNYDIIWKSRDGQEAGAGIFNGDIGYITQVDIRNDCLTVDFDEKLVTYPFDMLGELELAYAVTVHKAQGSEYRAVVMAAYRVPPILMTRSVLYTGVTRAKELLVVVGSDETLEKMVGNISQQRRYSGLRARLAGEV